MRGDLQDCWNQIGVLGDRSCALLTDVVHCRNCSVYGAAGRSLLERIAPPDYLDEWTEVLAEVAPPEVDRRPEAIVPSAQNQSFMLFQIGSECLALPVNCLQLITPPSGIHRVPHRPPEVLLGLVNIRGEILICVSLAALLGINPSEISSQTSGQPRWIVMGNPQQPWVSPVDEIYGIHRFSQQHFQAPPSVVSQTIAYTQGITYWDDRKVNILDSNRIFKGIQQAITPSL